MKFLIAVTLILGAASVQAKSISCKMIELDKNRIQTISELQEITLNESKGEVSLDGRGVRLQVESLGNFTTLRFQNIKDDPSTPIAIVGTRFEMNATQSVQPAILYFQDAFQSASAACIFKK